jgi:hypothetical protein
MSDIIEVVIGFDRNKEEIKYIKSDFMNEDEGFKDPIGYTAQLIQMGLEKWIREKVGISCPNCDREFKEGWSYCPNCGWNPDE